MKTILIGNSITSLSPALIFICILNGLLIYVMATYIHNKQRRKKIIQIKNMIDEGHEKAINGNKKDGIFQETQIEKKSVSTNLEMEQEAINLCDQRLLENKKDIAKIAEKDIENLLK